MYKGVCREYKPWEADREMKIPNLRGANPALVQILQMMQNRDANRDNSRKQFLMFPKESFTGQDKKLAKRHWAEFSKYLVYQNQQGTIPTDQQHLPEIISMFKLTRSWVVRDRITKLANRGTSKARVPEEI